MADRGNRRILVFDSEGSYLHRISIDVPVDSEARPAIGNKPSATTDVMSPGAPWAICITPWPDPNYAIDESWAAVDPYGSEARDGENVTLRLRILNHAPQRETYQVKWNVPAGWMMLEANREVAIPSTAGGNVKRKLAGWNSLQSSPIGNNVISRA